MRTLIKIDRLSAWGLFISMLLYFISGYGMTKGIIDQSLASKLHLSYLTYFVLAFFVIHTSYAIHLAFKRWRIWNGLSKAGLIIFYLLFIGAFFYVDLVYQKDYRAEEVPTNALSQETASSPASNSNDQNNTSQSTDSNTAVSTETTTFSLSELAKYNGKNGQPAYVAVDGVVYDMTSVFINGSHYSHIAGTELSDAFYSRHAKSAITKYPVVGTLE